MREVITVHVEDFEGPRQRLNVLLEIKPYSANQMHYAKGNGKTDKVEYRRFKADIFNALENHRFPVNPKDKYQLDLIVGYSSVLSDLDNSFKPLLDSMQKVLEFDDRQIFQINAIKDKVAKGDDYLAIKLTKITDVMWKTRIAKMFPGFLKYFKQRWGNK